LIRYVYPAIACQRNDILRLGAGSPRARSIPWWLCAATSPRLDSFLRASSFNPPPRFMMASSFSKSGFSSFNPAHSRRRIGCAGSSALQNSRQFPRHRRPCQQRNEFRLPALTPLAAEGCCTEWVPSKPPAHLPQSPGSERKSTTSVCSRSWPAPSGKPAHCPSSAPSTG